ncbi:MAG: phosphoribosylformylglycinamidine synthase subunit PurL [Planctomycetota bacterium]|nr:phosphoribosylformylglycinamidine synthase subunit PurL [Planctomycetota bacterium]
MASAPTVALPDAWRVEVFRKDSFDDPDGTHAQGAIAELEVSGLERIRMGRGYLLPPDLDRGAVDRIVAGLLADPVVDEARVIEPGSEPGARDAHRILVARKPGVMDPVATTLAAAMVKAGLLASTPTVGTFRAWELSGAIDEADLATIAQRVLANVVIEQVAIGSEGLFYGKPAGRATRRRVEVPLLAADDASLERLSTEGELSLDLIEMRAIQAHYKAAGREPSLAELETIAQTWSEHCQHKTFRGLIEMDGEVIDNLLKSTIAAATHELGKDWCVSVFHDNAGIIEFDPDVDGGWDLAFKVETHNHPSAIDPYGGAGTGIGGVIRDILGVGLGAKPIANIDAFFVGPPDLPREDVPKGSMHPRRILRGVVAGVRDYGNRMGIPTISGGVWFHEGYVANPLVYAGTLGLLPRSAATKEVKPGDVILVAGGRTGRDGIHGATFSSVELSEDSETVSAGAVQIGDPITEKRLLDGLLRARDAGLYRGLTDCGAGGLSSAVGEMGAECGARVDLEQVPLKYPGLAPDEIWISEAQERMVMAVPPEDLDACIAVFAAECVEATAIGTFTDTGLLELFYEGDEVGTLQMDFLHEGTPRPTRQAEWTAPDLPDPGAPRLDDLHATLLDVLASPTISSKEWIIRQYDHEVQDMSVVKPLAGPAGVGPADGVVLKPLVESKKGAALGAGANARYGRLDPRAMTLSAIDEALRNVVCCYGDPRRTAILDNFSWGNCNKPDRLGSLVISAKACYEGAMAYGTPFISGKDSLNNEYRVGEESLAIPPTLYVSSLSIVPNVERCLTMDAKADGNLLILVGDTRPELGGSELHAHLGLDGGRVPCPDLKRAPKLFDQLHGAMKMGYLKSCHDLSEGGLAVAVAEMCLAGGLGADIDLSVIGHEPFPAGYNPTTTLLFSESPTRFLIEVEPGKKYNLQTKLMGVSCTPLGRLSRKGKLTIKDVGGAPCGAWTLDELREAFQRVGNDLGGFHGEGDSE